MCYQILTLAAFFYFLSHSYFETEICIFPLNQVEIIHCLDLQMNMTCYKYENW